MSARPMNGSHPGAGYPRRVEFADRALLALRVRPIWSALKREPAAFWLLCFYIVVEYWRLHQAYPALDVLPWGRVATVACLVAVLLHGRMSRPFQIMDGLILLFFAWLLLSGMASSRQDELWKDWAGYATWPLMYFLVSTIITTRRRILLFWLTLMVINLKMSEFGTRTWILRGFSFADWGVTGSPGWFQNSGEFAMEMTFFLGLSWFFLSALKPHLGKRKAMVLIGLLCGTAVASIVASSSRGSQLAGAAVLLAILVLMRFRVKLVLGIALALWVGWLAIPPEQKARFDSAGDDKTSESRKTYWREARQLARENPVLGIGYGNWGFYFASRHGPRVEEIHNTTLEAAAELGYPGAVLFYAMILSSFRANASVRRRAKRLGEWGTVFTGMASGLDAGMVGLLVASQFMSVLFYPVFWMSFALATALSEVVRRAEMGMARVRPPANGVSRWPRPSTQPVRALE